MAGATVLTPAWAPPEQAEEPSRAKEFYGQDIPMAIVAAALAASVFMPWYKGEGGLSVTAWESGTWGPIMAFLGAGSFLLIALRRLGVRVSLPFEEALLHEFAGWVALAGGVVKSRFRPGPEGLLGVSWGLWVGLGAAFVLAYLAGRMSPHAPLVRRPKWYRQKGGVVGGLVIVAVVAGSSVFGTINTASLVGEPFDPGRLPGFVTNELPDCAADFPVPAGITPTRGVEQPCQASLQSELPPEEVLSRMKATLAQEGWDVSESTAGATSTLTATRPRCATIAVVGTNEGSLVIALFGVCMTPTPSPG